MAADKTAPNVKISRSVNNLLASPPRNPPARKRERADPSVTPRKFRKFFAPRQRQLLSDQPSPARQALHDLHDDYRNQCRTPSHSTSSLVPGISQEPLHLQENIEPMSPSTRSSKRRRLHATPQREKLGAPQLGLLSPLQTSPIVAPSSPCSQPDLPSPIQGLRLFKTAASDSREWRHDVLSDDEDDEDDEDELPTRPTAPLRRIVTMDRRGFEAQLAQRMTGTMPRPGRQFMRHPTPSMFFGFFFFFFFFLLSFVFSIASDRARANMRNRRGGGNSWLLFVSRRLSLLHQS
jgi:hypothetical protein